MALLLLKLTLTPVLIGSASLAARRWGPSIGGWIVALPLTSGPVALYLAIDQGSAYATSTATASLGALLGDAAFALAYAWLSRRFSWPVCLLGGFAGFAAGALAMAPMIGGTPLLVFGVVAVAMTLLLSLAPAPARAREPAPTPAWDIPARMAAGTGIVLAITEASVLLGPQLSGVLAALPVYVSVLTVFAHQFEGADQALGIVRGLQVGLFGTIVFFLVVTTALEPLGIGPAFGGAIVATAAVQSISLRFLRRPIPPAVEVP